MNNKGVYTVGDPIEPKKDNNIKLTLKALFVIILTGYTILSSMMWIWLYARVETFSKLLLNMLDWYSF